MKRKVGGFTIPEVVVSMVVLSTFILAIMGLYTALIGSANVARVKSIALGVGTEQLEYLRSLPYDDLAIEGGTINSSGDQLPETIDIKRNNTPFLVTTSIQYVDDAYDGCLNYPAQQSYLCRNGPSTAPTDSNPRDYKLVDVVVKQKNDDSVLTRLSTQISARVAETGGNTGAILVTIIDSLGQPVDGASVSISNTTLSPNVNQTATSDTNGVALFLDVPPDTGNDFTISASKNGYSSLSTISASGSLTPTYPNLSVLTQQVAYSTLRIDRTSTESLKVSIVNENGDPIPTASFSIKGGVKLYTDPSNQSYSYTQNAIATNSSGEYMFSNMVPGTYYVCFTNSQCASGSWLSAVQVAFGDNSFQPISIPAGSTSQTGSGPMQIAKLVTSSGSASPRVTSINPSSVSTADPAINNFQFVIEGANLTGATVTLIQGGSTLNTSVQGSDGSNSISRTVDLQGKTGAWQVNIETASGSIIQTGISPGTLGGINVLP